LEISWQAMHFLTTIEMMKNTKTLLIDLDGTLLGAHYTRLQLSFIRSFVSSLGKAGFGPLKSLKLLHQLKLAIRKVDHQNNGVVNWDKSVNFFSQLSGLSPEDSRRILTPASMKCFQDSRTTLYAVPEAQDFINWAKNHYTLILATNPLWPLNVVLYRLSIAGISPEHFQLITHAENMSACKPNVEYYHELSEKLKLDPTTTLMIGNDHKKDGPAKQLGIDVVILENFSDYKKLRARLQKELER
jgi:FMN phosphatase YigB (HAD superfamily)